MASKKVLLLSPPTQGERPVIKDQYCSNTSKAGYYWIPIDLLILSGDLAQHFEVKVLDAIIEKKTTGQVLEEVLTFAPDHIVILSSVLTHFEDRALMRELKKSHQFKTTFIGDIFYFSPQLMIEFEEVDSIIYEYPCSQLVEYIQTGETSANLIYKKDGQKFVLPRVQEVEVSYHIPRHDLFPLAKYSVPFMVANISTSVLTNFGCKFSCNYCPASSVAYRQRTVPDIIGEFKQLLSQGISNIWIRDFTFALNKERTKTLLKEMIPLRLQWFCLSRAEVMDDEILALMQESGCYLIMMGVDTINEKSMKQVKRWQSPQELAKKIKDIEEKGIAVLCHMIIGLPGDEIRDTLRTIHFLCFSQASYLSINLFAARTGSAYFDEMSMQVEQNTSLDSYYGEEKNVLMAMVIWSIKYYAMLLFYLNPVRLLKISKRVQSKTQLKMMIKTALRMFVPQFRS